MRALIRLLTTKTIFLRPIIDGHKIFRYKIATDKAKNLNGQLYTLSVFYVFLPLSYAGQFSLAERKHW